MPSTVTQIRPDEATGFRHISDPANALIARLNQTQHPNVVKMHDFLDREIGVAKGLLVSQGAASAIRHIELCEARIDRFIDQLAREAEKPEHLEGLNAWHLTEAHSRLGRARVTIERGAGPADVDAKAVA